MIDENNVNSDLLERLTKIKEDALNEARNSMSYKDSYHDEDKEQELLDAEEINKLIDESDAEQDQYDENDIDMARNSIEYEETYDNNDDEKEIIVNGKNDDNVATMSPKERADAYREKNNVVKIKNAPTNMQKIQNDDDADEQLLSGLSEIMDENNKLSNELNNLYTSQEKARDHTLATKYQKEVALKSMDKVSEGISDDDTPTDDIDDIINQIESKDSLTINKTDVNASSDEELLDIIHKLESEKEYAEIEASNNHTGPSGYIIEEDSDYADSIEDILTENNIRIIKKSDNEKNAILDKFANSGDKVTITLPNSGIFVTISGAGPTEIMTMNEMTERNQVRYEMDKLSHICSHIVGSTVGKLRLSQLIKIVSYYDIDTLYYALYAATYPDSTEARLTCGNCNKSYYAKLVTRDLLMNPEDFEDVAENIKDNVTSYNILLNTSKLGVVYKKSFANKMIVYFRHPSIENYFSTKNKLTNESYSKYSAYIDILYSIKSILLRVEGNKFVEITDPNELLKAISTLKDPDDRYAIYAMGRSLIPSETPKYGIKMHKCPHCGSKIDSIETSMDSLLFTIAKQREESIMYKWLEKMTNEKKSKKK